MNHYLWQDFEYDVHQLLRLIYATGRPIEGIYAVPRGGLVLGVRLSHELDLPLVYGGVDKNILIVDDIADTGNTLEPFRKRGCQIATLLRHVNCPFVPTYYSRENSEWVTFPWEKQGLHDSACIDL